jgi:hypothetical protein
MEHKYTCGQCGDVMESHSLKGLILKVQIHTNPKNESHCTFLGVKLPKAVMEEIS